MEQETLITPEQISPEQIYEEYLERIKNQEMSADEAIDDVDQRTLRGEIEPDIKEEVIKKLMLLADQGNLMEK